MMTAARQKKGDPRLYGQGKANFEKAYREGAKPTSEPAFGGILSQLAAVERDRAYGGSDTLPYSMKAAHGGPVNNLPTVRMQEGTSYLPEYINPFAAADTAYDIGGLSSGLTPDFYEKSLHPGTWDETVADREAAKNIFGTGGQRLGWAQQFNALMSNPNRTREQEDRLGWLHRRLSQEGSGLQAGDLSASGEELLRLEGIAGAARDITDTGAEPGMLYPNVVEQGSQRPEVVAPEVVAPEVVAPEGDDKPSIEDVVTQTPKKPELVLSSFGENAQQAWENMMGLPDLSGEVAGREAVPSVAEIYKKEQELYPDLSGERKTIINKQAEALRTFKEQDVVPQSVKDIRDHLDGAVKALENNPLPWMRAAAAAIDGRKPILVAATHAMIGYTEGKEELRKEGLETMGKMADMDMQMATLESQQAKTIFEQESLINQARLSEIEGRENRAAELIAAASAQQTAIANRNVDIDRIRVTMATSFMQFMATDAGQSRTRMNDLFTEKQSNPEYFTISADGTATPTMKAWTEVMETIDQPTTSYAEQTAFFGAERHRRDILNQINDVRTDAMKLADENFDRELLAKDSAFKRWMADNNLSLPEGANVGDPSSKQLYQLWSITRDERYISDPVIQEAINKRFPELARIQSGGGSGGTDTDRIQFIEDPDNPGRFIPATSGDK